VRIFILTFVLLFNALATTSSAATPAQQEQERQSDLQILRKKLEQKARPIHGTLTFDIPVTYNNRVAYWMNHYQTKGKNWFRGWLEKSTKYMPFIQAELRQHGMPADLGYMVMIESGFDPYARSSANAVGPWQFMQATGATYGLRTNWWIDERKDFKKATLAAIRYMKDLHQEFGSWYLVAASYNMGENGLRRKVIRHRTRDFWALSKMGALPQETTDYVPKILAAILIAKSPSLYGFGNLTRMQAFQFETAYMPGGTDLNALADKLGVTRKSLRDLNSELILGYVPAQIGTHSVRVPMGSQQKVLEFLQAPRSLTLNN
jgi:membrane-bound lytic murein transglycosylase D